jgi:hypothetical protein
MKRTIILLFIAGIIVILVSSCLDKTSKNLSKLWPPPKKQTVALNFKPDTVLHFNKWENLDDRMAFVLTNFKIKLEMNYFENVKPIDEFVPNQFEIVYYDEKQTFIAVDSTKNDIVYFKYFGPGKIGSTYENVGTKVRYIDKIYKLKSDGWYIDTIRVFSFSDTLSIKNQL